MPFIDRFDLLQWLPGAIWSGPVPDQSHLIPPTSIPFAMDTDPFEYFDVRVLGICDVAMFADLIQFDQAHAVIRYRQRLMLGPQAAAVPPIHIMAYNGDRLLIRTVGLVTVAHLQCSLCFTRLT
jgi:hypothetical protein